MLLRPAVPGDETAVAVVHVRSWQIAYDGLLPEPYLDGLRPEDWASQYTFADAAPGRPSTVVAVERDAICGFASVGPSRDADRPDTGQIYAIYVDPASWGTGVGLALMSDARSRLGGQGYQNALLWAMVGNDRAERFYRIDGWQPDGSGRREEIRGVTVDEIRYTRQLAGISDRRTW